MGQAFEIALDAAQLVPGDYQYANYFRAFQIPHLSSFMPMEFDSWERYSEFIPMPIPEGETITFHLSDEHLKLLRHIRVTWDMPNGYTGINFKRPYGDMAYFELDMARILEVPIVHDEQNEVNFSDEQRHHFHELHTDMLYALPVLLRHGEVKIGHYHLDDNTWTLVS